MKQSKPNDLTKWKRVPQELQRKTQTLLCWHMNRQTATGTCACLKSN